MLCPIAIQAHLIVKIHVDGGHDDACHPHHPVGTILPPEIKYSQEGNEEI